MSQSAGKGARGLVLHRLLLLAAYLLVAVESQQLDQDGAWLRAVYQRRHHAIDGDLGGATARQREIALREGLRGVRGPAHRRCQAFRARKQLNQRLSYHLFGANREERLRGGI